MHETALMTQLLRRIEREARAAGAARVKAVRLRVGELSGVEPRLLESAFDWLAPGTVADGASLEIEPVPLEASCEACGQRFRVEQFRFRCPTCGGDRTRAVAGEDLILESLTIEDEREPAGAETS